MTMDVPVIMGIINLTKDSFYANSRVDAENLVNKVKNILDEGADIIDLGACSSRPGAKGVPVNEEVKIITSAVELIKSEFPDSVLSVDTFRSEVAETALVKGADIINDISAGQIDPKIHRVVANYQCPYILMHMKGTPENMQNNPKYDNVCTEVFSFLNNKIDELVKAGINDIIIDPGFGFGKSIEDNFKLLRNFEHFTLLQRPLLAGLSRKSMIWKTLETTPENALNGTSFCHSVALMKGANILRVHDVKEARELVLLHQVLNETI